ncbi:MAG: hypothetical protein IMF11_12350 [Proteobacteria bacterium]|nr:hypothetical protein [Pseudomonadota bacterium]
MITDRFQIKKIALIIALLSLFSVNSLFAANGTIIIEPVDIHFENVDSTLPTVYNVEQLTFFGVEYRNTTDEDGDGTLSAGDTARIDGVFAVSSFISNGGMLMPPDFLNTWEMTGTYVALQDILLPITVAGTIPYVARTGVGILTLYVSTDMTQRAAAGTGLGYDDGTMVAQFAVSSGGGVYTIIAPFDGSRDVFLLKQSGLSGFFDPEITGAIFDSNLDADSDSNGIGGDVPVPTAWKHPTTGVNFPWSYYVYADGSMRFGNLQIEGGECRVTGGGVDVNDNIVIGTEASALDNRYTFGGQVGAPTATQPQPWGEWTHHQQKGKGVEGRFVFHGGTASAPPGTEILWVGCTDPGYCNPARPAPFKQIDFEGVGTFKNISSKITKKCEIRTDGSSEPTLHYFRVHIEDMGEPGSVFSRATCKHKIGEPITEDDCQNCPDVYQIEIHCTNDPNSDVIYSVGAFIDGGNLQIHPPVGEHMNP